MTPEIQERIAQLRRGEVPEGYKKTKAGIILSQWKNVRIKDICEINPHKCSDIIGKVTFLGMKDVSENGTILNQNYINTKDVKAGLTPFKRGDILIAKITPCFENGKGALTSFLNTEYGFGSTEFHVLRSKVDNIFLFYHTISYRFRRGLESEMTGSAGQKRVQTDSLASYSLGLPSTIEQHRIASILTTQDKVIELKEKLLEQKKQQKKYLMQQLLTGKKRLPGFSGDWKENRLGNIFAERKETNRTDLDLLAITGTQGVVPRNWLNLKDNSSEDKSKYLHICVGDIGYNTMRMWQGVSALSAYEGIVSPAYTILKPKAEIDVRFFSYLFKLPEVVFLFYRYSQGLVDDTRNLKYENFKKIKVTYPEDVREQNAIADVLSTADREINLLQQCIDAEKQKKKALMQLLLTGIVRVKA